jgi:uncharacterized protein
VRFDQLVYYDPNPDLVFDLVPEEFAEKANIRMQTSTGDTRYYQRWGTIRFSVDGHHAELTLYLSPGNDGFFVPVMDTTSGKETYGAGRYLDFERRADGRVHLDFNQAYNPYCAYNEPQSLAVASGREPREWSCPIPPKENRLTGPIRAGQKKPEGDWFEPEHE